MAELSLPGAGLPLEWHGEDLVLLPGRALWLPRLAALVIADWHLGKDDVLRRAGIALPAGSLDGELARLDGLLAHTLARELVVLGDLVHGAVHRGAPWQQALAAGPSRLAAACGPRQSRWRYRGAGHRD